MGKHLEHLKKNRFFSAFRSPKSGYLASHDIGLIKLNSPVLNPSAVIPLCNRKPPPGQLYGMCGVGSTHPTSKQKLDNYKYFLTSSNKFNLQIE